MEKKKLVFQLDTPYSTVPWPQISPDDQDTILELLCSLLSPIGHHRSRHVQPSRGKREKKRKRKEGSSADSEAIVPPAPEVGSFVDVGLSTVTRSLQAFAAKEDDISDQAVDSEMAISDGAREGQIYSAVFVARSGYPKVLSNHLPQMVAVASASRPSSPPTRLVGLSKGWQDRLSDALGIPRVSCIGLREGAPNSKALLDYTRDHVPVTVGAWLREAQDAGYEGTKINTIETTIGTSKQKRK